MSKQWHPLFAHLLRLLLDRYYSVQTEVPVSDLPRRGDLLLLRRQTVEAPPFTGLWSHLTDWNVLEFKGPGDYAHEDDLELLLHVGTGLTVRFNEERVAAGKERLANEQLALWYVAPTLGETFLGHARTRAAFDYQTGGLWRARVWGHPVWLVSAHDLPVEEDTIPLHLLDRDPPAPRAVGELMIQQEELLRRFATWLSTLQPRLWEEIRHMAKTSTGMIDWEAVGKFANLDEVVRLLPPEHVIQVLGIDRALEVIGLPRLVEVVGLPRLVEAVGLARLFEVVGLPRVIETVGLPRLVEAVSLPRLVDTVGLPRLVEAVGLPRLVEAVGLPRLVEAVGLPRVIEISGPEKVLKELLKLMSPEQVQEMLQRQQRANGEKGAE